MSEPYWSALGGGVVDYEGDFSPATQYAPGDVVRYGGVDFLAVNPSLGVTPPGVFSGVPGEMAYAEITTSVTATVVAEASAPTVVTAPAVICDGVTPIVVDFFSEAVSCGTGAQTLLSLFMDGASLGWIGQVIAPGQYVPVRSTRRLTPSAGSHTFSVRAYAFIATGTVVAGPGGVGVATPAFIRVSRANPTIPVSPGHLVPVSYATTLPASPVDGQEAILVDSLTAPTYSWRFRYNAGSTHAQKWEYTGGAPAVSSVGVGTSTTVGGITDLSNYGPAITVPRPGVYLAQGSAGCTHQVEAQMGLNIVDEDGATIAYNRIFYANENANVSVQRLCNLSAANEVRLRYTVAGGAGQHTWGGRVLTITPVRVA